MKHKILFGIAALAAGVALSAQAQQQTPVANFQGHCTRFDISTHCAFDSRLPAAQPSGCGSLTVVPTFVWDFSDGSARVVTREPTIVRNFGNVVGSDLAVRLTVLCGETSGATRTRRICRDGQVGIPGECILPNGTWN